jgi:hypothetical protein
MIDNILDYIDSFDEIRAVTGLNSQELPDATLGLKLYARRLSKTLSETSGIFSPSTVSQTLQEIFDGGLSEDDELYGMIQMLSIYTVADAVMDSVGLRAYKSMADGKSNLTRFSPESTYKDVRQAVKENIDSILQSISTEFGDAAEALNYLSVVSPDVDLVIGEE